MAAINRWPVRFPTWSKAVCIFVQNLQISSDTNRHLTVRVVGVVVELGLVNGDGVSWSEIWSSVNCSLMVVYGFSQGGYSRRSRISVANSGDKEATT